jgi:hypothetical protein
MKNYTSPAVAMDDLRKRGYKADFTMSSFCLYCGDLDMRLNPDEFKVDEEYRFDGDINDEEDTIVVAITSTSGIKGVLVDGYGSYTGDANLEKAKQA